jgi:hypothetical protein
MGVLDVRSAKATIGSIDLRLTVSPNWRRDDPAFGGRTAMFGLTKELWPEPTNRDGCA